LGEGWKPQVHANYYIWLH